jgi:hypothetical protein
MQYETVTLERLKQNAAKLGYAVNTIKNPADLMVLESENDDVRIYCYCHRIEGHRGVLPTIYSIYPEPPDSIAITMPIIGQGALFPEGEHGQN